MRAMIYLDTRFVFGLFTAFAESFCVICWGIILLTIFIVLIVLLSFVMPFLRPFRRVLGNFSQNLRGYTLLAVENWFPKIVAKIRLKKNEAESKVKKPFPLSDFIFKLLGKNRKFPGPLVPTQHDAGRGPFVTIGNKYLDIFKGHGLKADMRVLDIGCGKGRMARPVSIYFGEHNSQGHYVGFDIVKDDIEWCKKTYADAKLSHFKFSHSDVYNKRYNVEGKVCAHDYMFEIEGEPLKQAERPFDFVLLISVFTHMTEAAVSNYLKQIESIMKPGSICLATWFLLDDNSIRSTKSMRSWFLCRHLFKYNYRFRKSSITGKKVSFEADVTSNNTCKCEGCECNGCQCSNCDCQDSQYSMCSKRGFPEAAIAYKLSHVKDLYEKYGLVIKEEIYGHWARPGSENELQDLIVAIKPEEPSP